VTISAPSADSPHDLSHIVVPRKPLPARARTWVLWLTIAALLAWSWGPTEMRKIGSLFTDWRNMAEFASGFLRPDFSDWRAYAWEMLETVQIAVWGTALAVFFGIPFAILSSANVCPVWIVQPVRRLMDSFRAINEIVFALLFVVAVGLGPLAGVLALTVHNIGIVAKLFSEAVEAIDPRPVEGIRATGASRLQEVVFGVVPQVMPLWSPSRSTASKPTSAPLPCSASSVPAASAIRSMRTFAASTIRRRRRSWSSWCSRSC
jgi:phosphonate transport system permease protein